MSGRSRADALRAIRVTREQFYAQLQRSPALAETLRNMELRGSFTVPQPSIDEPRAGISEPVAALMVAIGIIAMALLVLRL